jgi:putative tricarboxylic transport membrane protein
VFWSNWLVGTITTLALLMLLWPVLAFAWRKLRQLPDGATASTPGRDAKLMEK